MSRSSFEPPVVKTVGPRPSNNTPVLTSALSLLVQLTVVQSSPGSPLSKIFPSSSKTPVIGSPAGAVNEVKRFEGLVELLVAELSVERVDFIALAKRADVAAQVAMTNRLSTTTPIISFQKLGLLLTGGPPCVLHTHTIVVAGLVTLIASEFMKSVGF